jgi:hypothetical protein
MPCGYCRLPGHNVRTCNAQLFDEAMEDFPMEVGELEDFTRMNLQALFDTEEDPITNEELERDECIICYDAIPEGNVKLKCNHKYCLSCFVQHMRTKSECAYCRQTVCDVPAPKKQLEMSMETKRAILEHFLNNSEDIVEMFKDDFVRQMRASVIDQQQMVRSRTTEKMIDACTTAAESVDMSFAMWSAGVRMSEYMSDWYER